ncbi:gamma-glutamyltransferase [Pseudomonas lalucatii]|nr:gamma-glutamyltransferase [Pseudomonas lalucatii]
MQAAGQPGRAAIASAHPAATVAGQETLARGGNAFDAAVAIAAALAVVEPYGSGLGGGGFFLLREAGERPTYRFLDARERAPLAAHPDLYRRDGEVQPALSLNGALAAAIPGLPAALVELAQRFGRLPLRDSWPRPFAWPATAWRSTGSTASALAGAWRPCATIPSARIFLDEGDSRRAEPAASTGAGPHPGTPGPRRPRRLLRRRHRGTPAERRARRRRHLVAARSRRLPGRGAPAPARDTRRRARADQCAAALRRRSGPGPEPAAAAAAALAPGRCRATQPFRGRGPAPRLPRPRPARRPGLRRQPDRAAARPRPPRAAGGEHRRRTGHPQQQPAARRRLARGRPHHPFHRAGRRRQCGGRHPVDQPAVRRRLHRARHRCPAQRRDGRLRRRRAGRQRLRPGRQPGQCHRRRQAPAVEHEPDLPREPARLRQLRHPGGSRIPSMVLLAILEYLDGQPIARWPAVPRYHHQFRPDVIEHEPGAFAPQQLAALAARGHRLKAVGRQYGNQQVLLWDKRDKRVEAASDPRGIGTAVTFP